MQLVPPVSPADFSARLAAFELGDRFAIAVSGGRDSMALMRICAEAAKKEKLKVTALIVDHGLREGSSQEAGRTKSWCSDAGIDARILTWRGPKPQSGLQAAARKARYFLMAQAANELALPAILTAHSADDQAETVMMRLARGAGPAGLAAMRSEARIAAGAGDPVRLVRPLLSETREGLTAMARHYGQDYFDDPSNEDNGFERVRVRRALRRLYDDSILARDGLLRTAARMEAAHLEMREREARAFAAVGGVFTRWGGASVDGRSLSAGRIHQRGAIARAIFAVSGADHAPDPEEAGETLKAAVETGAATLGGALLKTGGGRLWILREPGALLGRAGVAPMGSAELPARARILWDNRFIVTTKAAATLRPLGPDGAAALGAAARLAGAPGEAILSAPGLFQGDRLIGAPGLLSREDVEWSMTPLAAERFAGGIVRYSQE